jgi:hypothetical protein
MARILDMISAATKLVLIPDPRPDAMSRGVRRFRIARLAVNPKRGPRDQSFAHLKRVYD